MTIEHQKIVDEDGNPTAAVIPWELFRIIQAELEFDPNAPLDPDYKSELNRRLESYRDGSAKTLSRDQLMEGIQVTLSKCEADRKKTA